MYQEYFNTLSGSVEDYFAPAKKMAELSISSTEKLFALQMALTKGYFELGMEQVKAVLAVKDPESFQSFVTKQAEVAKTVGEKVMADVKAVAELNAEVGAEVQKLAEEGLKTVVSAPVAKAKKAA